MKSWFDDHFKTVETSLKLHAYRQEVLASNIANEDTPNYKARDFDFKSAFNSALNSGSSTTLAATNSRHLQPSAVQDVFAPTLQYRSERQPSIDGNTVDMDTEMKEFTDNAIRLQADLSFVQMKISGMKTALSNQ